MDNLYNVIEKLVFLKKRKSVGAMCDEIGISRTTMSNLKKGKSQTLRMETMMRIAEYLDMSVGELTQVVHDEQDKVNLVHLELQKSENEYKEAVTRLLSYALMLSKNEKLYDIVENAAGLSDSQLDAILQIVKGVKNANTKTD